MIVPVNSPAPGIETDKDSFPTLNKTNSSNKEYVSRLERFFFCIKLNEILRNCCCGCTLKVGVIMICIIGSLEELIMTLNTYSNIAIIPLVIITALSFIGFLLMLVSSYNYKASYAYYGYLLFCGLLILKTVLYISIILIVIIAFDQILFLTKGFQMYYVLVFYIVTFFVDISLKFYYLLVFYSYTKYLSLEEYEIINGVDLRQHMTNIIINPENNINQYQNIQYSPSSNHFISPDLIPNKKKERDIN